MGKKQKHSFSSDRKEAAKRKKKNFKLVVQTFFRILSRYNIYNISYVTVTIEEEEEEEEAAGGREKNERRIICTRTCELRLTDSSKPEDTFRADNRTRNASTMPRKA